MTVEFSSYAVQLAWPRFYRTIDSTAGNEISINEQPFVRTTTAKRIGVAARYRRFQLSPRESISRIRREQTKRPGNACAKFILAVVIRMRIFVRT